MKLDKNKTDTLKASSRRYFYTAIILTVAMVISVAVNGWLFFGWNQNDTRVSIEKIEDQYNLLNPARKSVEQEDLIINFQPLRDYLNDKYEADPNISIYFEYLPTGASIATNKDAEF